MVPLNHPIFLGDFPWVPQVRLNALCMRIAKRPLEKGETLYDTQQIGVGKDLCCIGSLALGAMA